MTTTQTQDLDTAQAAAKKSAREAFDQLATTEPERSRQADGLEDAIDGGFYPHEMEWLEDELGRDRTDKEEEEYISTWKETIRDLKEGEGLA